MRQRAGVVRESENTRASWTREVHFVARDTPFQLTPYCSRAPVAKVIAVVAGKV